MPQQHVVIVSGLPGAGKTRVARQLAARYLLPLVAKDTIKESLFDSLGAGDARWSSKLSNASFAAMFAVVADVLAAGQSILLEGNFRAGAHDHAIAILLAKHNLNCIQVLCRAPEPLRRERLELRAERAERHPGHLDRLFLRRKEERELRANMFLDLPGEQHTLDTADTTDASMFALQNELDNLLRTNKDRS